MKRSYIILLVLLLGISTQAYGQDARYGTNAASQLLVSVDAQFLGGASAVANATGIEGVLWNPAALDRGTGDVMVMLSRRNYIADIGLNFGAVGFRFGGFGTIAVHMRSFSFGEIEETDAFNMDGTGESFEPTFFTLGAAYGRQMTDRISFGVGANLVYESFANVGASGVTFDAGVQYAEFLGVSGLRIGVAIRNIGTSMEYDGSDLYVSAEATEAGRPVTQYQVDAADADMPTVYDISASYNVYQGLNIGVTYLENTYGPSQMRSLASYNFQDYLTVRGAYTMPVAEEDVLEDIWATWAAGVGLNLENLVGMGVVLDYAYMPVEYLDANHVFTLRGSF